MAIGAVLLGAALINATIWRSVGQQAMLGGVLALGGFALANSLQGLWRLAAGWALGAGALLLGALGRGLGAWAVPAAWLLAAVAAVVIVMEFVRRMPDPDSRPRR
jgi:hypothetical protein